MAKVGGASLSLGARTVALSVLVHASLAAVVVAHGVPSRSVPTLVDVDLAVTELPPPPPTPPPPPEEHVDLPAPQAAVPRPPDVPRPVSPPAAHPAAHPAAGHPSAAAAALENSAQDSAPVVAAAEGPPTFVMALPVASVAGVAAPARAANEVVDERGVSVRAAVAFGPAPVYPAEARAAQIEVDVPLEIVVNPEGEVVLARVTRHMGYGFEDSAIDAIRRYRFTPAQRDGQAVAVRMLWTMQYRLR